MARLVLVNGAPCSGRSTLARRYAADHPLALALDVDVVRSMLGRSVEDPQAAGLAGRELALAMAHAHLLAGHDVVVPQLLARVAFIAQLEALAAEVGAAFVEVVVRAELPEVLARFRERSERAVRPEHRDAAELVRRAGGRGRAGGDPRAADRAGGLAASGPLDRGWGRDGRRHLRPAARRAPLVRVGVSSVRVGRSVRLLRPDPAWWV